MKTQKKKVGKEKTRKGASWKKLEPSVNDQWWKEDKRRLSSKTVQIV